jgi:hypothetical protein
MELSALSWETLNIAGPAQVTSSRFRSVGRESVTIRQGSLLKWSEDLLSRQAGPPGIRWMISGRNIVKDGGSHLRSAVSAPGAIAHQTGGKYPPCA